MAILKIRNDADDAWIEVSGGGAGSGGDLMADGTVPMTADWPFGNYGLYIGDSANAQMTIGLTINQGANDDEILALKSSDVGHGLTTYAETDTFTMFKKANNHATEGGGLQVNAFAEDYDTGYPVLQFRAFGGQAKTDKGTTGRSLIEFTAYEHDNANSLANITADGNVFGIRCRVDGSVITRWICDEDGDTWQSGSIFVNESANSKQTLGITINQGGYDNEILAFKSGDVDHDCTTRLEADTYAGFQKISGVGGGLLIHAAQDSNAANCCALMLIPISDVATDTTKSTSARAIMEIYPSREIATDYSNVDDNGNIFAIRPHQAGTWHTRFLVDVDGDVYIDGNLYDIGDTDTYINFAGSNVLNFYTGNNKAIGISASGEVSKPLQPAFQAYLTSNITNIAINTTHTLTLDAERFDVTSDFNTSTYTFTAPITGKYQLNLTLRWQNTIDTAATYMYSSIVTSNKTYNAIIAPKLSTDYAYHSFDVSVVADMDASDTAYVTYRQQGGSQQCGLASTADHTRLSGFLLG